MSSSGATPSGHGGGGSTANQANDITRNLLLGLPREGPAPGSAEAAELQAAEAFVADIQQEILAYDVANAQAMEVYARQCWSKVPFFGRRAKAAIQQEEAAKAAEGATTVDPSLQHAATAAVSGSGLRHEVVKDSKRGVTIERTSALTPEELQRLGPKGSPPPKVNAWLFKRNHPSWVPLMQRWWVPWLCIGSICLVWTPDVWKLRALYLCDYQYAQVRRSVHLAYWRATMSPEDYTALIADLEAQRPTSVKTSDCPF